ncbi:MAG: hypothetical protein D6B28_08850, partial [Gammaproteobacteria bacterium]
SEKVVATRKSVIEFMLINHPLDCLVCDQGGDCELQDMVYQFGADNSRFCEPKVEKQPEDISPLIAVNANRCIKCMRCVRFLEEISGQRELGMLNRGENCKISSFYDDKVTSKLSGNTIDVCPVGALLAKSATHAVRPWELKRTESVSPYDALGTNINIDTFANKVIKIIPRHNSGINGSWISDQDRFGFLGLEYRVEQPLVNGEVTPWEQVQEDLGRVFADNEKSTLFMVSPTATVEQMLAVENLAAAMPNAQIGYSFSQHRQIQGDTEYFPVLGMSLEQLLQSDLIIIAGVDLDQDLPVLAARLRKANCRVVMIDPQTPDAGLVKNAQSPVLLFGKAVSEHVDADQLRESLQKVFAHGKLKTGDISGGANSAGAAILQSLRSCEDSAKSFSNVVLVGDALEEIAGDKMHIISSAEHVIALMSTTTEAIKRNAHIILPIPAWTEVSGSFVNMQLNWQCFKAAIKAPDAAREIEQICAMIAKAAKVAIFRKISEDQFADKLKQIKTEQQKSWSAQC